VILYAQTLGKAKGYYSVTGEAMGFLLLNFLFLWLPGRFFRVTALSSNIDAKSYFPISCALLTAMLRSCFSFMGINPVWIVFVSSVGQGVWI